MLHSAAECYKGDAADVNITCIEAAVWTSCTVPLEYRRGGTSPLSLCMMHGYYW